MTELQASKINFREGSLFALFFALPFHPWFASGIIVVLLVITLISSSFSALFKKVLASKAILFLLLYFVLGLLSLIWSSNWPKGLSIVETSAGFLLLPVIIAGFKLDEKSSKKALLAFVAGCLLALLLCYGNALIVLLSGKSSLSTMDIFTYEHLASGLGMQPIYLAMYFIMAALIAFYLFSTKFSKYYKALLALASVFVIAVLMLSSRMEIMALLVICSLGIIKWAKDKGKLKLAFPMLLGLMVVAVGVISLSPTNRARFQEMFDFNSDYTENQWGGRSLRLQKWKYSSEVIAENLLVGVGLGDMQDELQKVYIENEFELGYSYKFNSHNQYFQSALGLGITGLILFLFAIFFAVKKAIRMKDWLYFSFILLFVLSCITESMLLRQKGAIFFALFIAFFSLRKEKHVDLNKAQ